MARGRMFNLDIVDTNKFLEMPGSTQALYFQLGMRADDDGFIENSKYIAKNLGFSDDDMKILRMKGFIIPFNSGFIVLYNSVQIGICNAY